MKIAIGDEGLYDLLRKQLENNFLCDSAEAAFLRQILPEAISATARCFNEIANKYYWGEDNQLLFNPFHSGQYSIFLYFLSHAIWKNGNGLLADKVYYLNKMLNSCDLFYEIELPRIFFLDHPVGTVIGRASFGNYLVFQQNCTIGGNNGIYPTFGEFVWLFANATVIGKSTIGSNVFISANSFVKDEDIPDNTIVFGSSPNLVLKSRPRDYFHDKSPFTIHRELI